MKVMRVKNLLCAFLILSMTSICYGRTQKTIDQKELDFDDICDAFEDKTPLQFSTDSIKNFFKSHALPTIALRGRTEQERTASRNTHFNKSFSKYIKDVYNKRSYAQSLSQDGQPILDYLELCNNFSMDQTTVYVGMRLFNNKIKSCELIDDTVILQLLKPLPDILERFFDEEKNKEATSKASIEFLRKHTEDVMLTRFTEDLPEFQDEPDIFLSNLSDELTNAVKKEFAKLEKAHKKNLEKYEARERLRQTIIKFFETALSKTIWNTKSYEGIWNSFLTIANQLQHLGTHLIIDHMDDLDDLLWSLTHRFCYFLELTGAYLPVTFYEEIEIDLHNQVVYFLEAQEQDDAIKTKKEILTEALIKAKTKAIAFKRGIVSRGF